MGFLAFDPLSSLRWKHSPDIVKRQIMGTAVELLTSHDFRSLALSQIEEAATRHMTRVEVPESAVGHIIGKSHRTINKLRQMPGIIHVSVHEDLESMDKQIVLVEGSKDAVADVLAQIKRLHMRSCAASLLPEMHYSCFVVGATPNARSDDPFILRIVSEDKLSLHMPQHLRSFLYRKFPKDLVDDRTYYYFHSRSSGEAAALSFIVQPRTASDFPPALVPVKPSIRRKFLVKNRASQVLGSWERAGYHHYLSDALSKLIKDAPDRDRSFIKIRLLIGKTMYYGTSLCKGQLWKLSVSQLDDKVLYQTLRPLFSVYSSGSVRRARQFLHSSGYQHAKFTQMMFAELVDMDSKPGVKESYHFEIDRSWDSNEVQDEPAVRLRKACKRHTFLTFLNDNTGVDMELRIQSRESEEPLDPTTKRSLLEAWHKRHGVEQPLLSPSGRRYYPLNVLHKDAETYCKDGFEVILTNVTTVDDDVAHEEKSLSCRWKVAIRSKHLQNLLLSRNIKELELARQAEDISRNVDLSLREASNLATAIAVRN